jgi:crossover junction endodeoxyribonuclease RuvC
MTFIGIDPGLGGAIALLSADGKIVAVWDMPVLAIKKGKKLRHEYLPAEIYRLLQTVSLPASVLLELVRSRPGQGVTSMFSMGRGVGVLEGVIASLGLPLTYTTPQSWKKAMELRGSDKQASILKAQQLIPGSAKYLILKKHDGRAEALLIAEYNRRKS